MTNLDTGATGLAVLNETPTDADLHARWCGGAGDALELLIRRHGGMVLGVCRRVLGNAPDADDAFQATFLIFVQKARNLARPEQIAGWLHAVALRVARKARASRSRRREREVVIVDTADPADTNPPDPTLDLQDLRRTIDEELDRLPDKYRLPIVLCELEGRTLEEAARLLAWPKGTVAGRLSRGRELLRQRLSRRKIGLPLFLILPIPAVEVPRPAEPLVSSMMSNATGKTTAPAQPAALANAVLRDGLRRRIGLVALLILAALLIPLGWIAQPALARQLTSDDPSPPCHTPPPPFEEIPQSK